MVHKQKLEIIKAEFSFGVKPHCLKIVNLRKL